MENEPSGGSEASQKKTIADAKLRAQLNAALKGEYPSQDDYLKYLSDKDDNPEPVKPEEPETTFTLARLVREPLDVLGQLGCMSIAFLPFILVGWSLLSGAYQFLFVDEHRRIYVDAAGAPTQTLLEWYQGRTFWEQQKVIIAAKLQEEMSAPKFEWSDWDEYEEQYSDDEIGRLRRKADKLEWEQLGVDLKKDSEQRQQTEIERLSALLKKVDIKLSSPEYRGVGP